MLPYSVRRVILEELEVEKERVRLVATFEDGEALFAAVCGRGLEGVVAKRTSSAYVSGDRCSWVETKNRSTPRFGEERLRAVRQPGGREDPPAQARPGALRSRR